MTQLLIRLFIRHPDNPQDPHTRAAYGNLASIVGMVCNVLLCLGKLAVGTLFGSIAIMADALNNLSDASSNIVSLVGFKLASRAPDAEHPFGHARYEYLAGLAVSVMILVIGVELLKESFAKVLHPTEVAFSWLMVAVLIASILVKLWMSRLNRQIGTAIDSETLLATAADARNDVITTAAVLAATILTKLTGFARIDGLMGIGVAAFILYSGAMLVKDTINPLLGAAPDSDLVEHIEKKALSYPGVLGVHDLMIHDYGPGRQFASVHVEMSARRDPIESHEVIDGIERDFLKDERLHLVVHYDPVATDDPRVPALRDALSDICTKIHPKMTIHDLRVVQGAAHVNVVFDCVVPYDCQMSETEIRRRMNDELEKEYPGYTCIATLERSYTE